MRFQEGLSIAGPDADQMRSSIAGICTIPYANQAIGEYLSAVRNTVFMPPSVHSAVQNFIEKKHGVGYLHIQGLPIDAPDIGYEKQTSISEGVLLAVSSLLGEVYGYSSQRDGAVIQNLIPRRQDAGKQLGTNSVDLIWHTEDAHTRFNCNYIGLLCLRGDAQATTLISQINPSDLPADVLKQLAQPDYRIAADASHSNQNRKRTSVITLDDGKFEMRYDPLYTESVHKDAEVALEALTRIINAKYRSVTLTKGDLLFIDNDTSVHARTAYSPQFNGKDRWIQRVAILSKTVPPEICPGDPHVIDISAASS